MDESIIKIENISSSYQNVEVLKSVSLSIKKGEIFALLGPSGCGKTTLLRIISGLHRPNVGTVRVNGSLVDDISKHIFVSPEKRNVGMVFQDGALFPHMTVSENIEFGISDDSNKKSRVNEVLELVGLEKFEDRSPETLSGGQKQRVALARALAPKPPVILLDEPFSALDTSLRSVIRKEVKQILKEVGCTAILVTHDQDEAFLLGDRVGVMNSGEILQVGSSIEIYENPSSPWISSFVGEANTLKGTIDGGQIQSVLGSIPASEYINRTSGVVTIIVRPEQLDLLNGEMAEIVNKQYFGHDVLYTVRCYQLDIADLNIRSTSNHFSIGEKVDVKFIGESVSGW